MVPPRFTRPATADQRSTDPRPGTRTTVPHLNGDPPMLSLVPFVLCAALAAYLLTREVRSMHAAAPRPSTAAPPVAATAHRVAATARQRHQAARNATDPN